MLLKISFESPTPIYQQIRDQIILAMAKEALLPGENLPTVRQLAKDIGVNPMTINKAYNQLKDEGYVVIDRRHGARIQDAGLLKKEKTEHLIEALELILSEAKLKGMTMEDLSKVTQRIYGKRRD